MSRNIIIAFDSGIGGLSALGPLLKEARDLEVFYFGDLANLPYGSKSVETVRTLVREGFEKLISHITTLELKPQAAILACNTASAVALDVVQKLSMNDGNFPVYGVIDSGSRAVLKGKGKRIVILGTQATVKSEAYPETLRAMGCTKPLLQKACPLFVPLVEENMLEGPAVDWIVDHYLKDLLKEGDDVVLGCTHYPFLQKFLKKKFPHCEFFNAGDSLLELSEILPLKKAQGPNKIHFLFSDESVSSMSLKELLLKCGILGVDWTQLRL